jgi:hypothetical protein
MSQQNQKTSGNKSFILILERMLSFSIAFSGSIFFCALFPPFWNMPYWAMLLLIFAICLALYFLIASLAAHLFQSFGKTKAEYVNLGLLMVIVISMVIWLINGSLQKALYLPDVNLEIALQSKTNQDTDILIDLPQVTLASQTISPGTGSNIPCTITDNQLSLSGQETCSLSYPVPISRVNNLTVTLPHTSYPVDAVITIRHIRHNIDMAGIDGKSIRIEETVDPSFSPKKIRYSIWTANVYFCTFFLILFLHYLENSRLCNLLNRFSKKRKNIANYFLAAFFILVALIYTVNRLTPNAFHFVNLYSDAANIASFAAANAHPENFLRDPFLSDPVNYNGYFVFHVPLIQGLGNLFNDYSAAFTVLLFPTILLQLFGYYFLGKTLFKNQLLGFLLSLTTLFTVSIPYFSNEFFGLYGDVVPRVLFQAVLPYVLILLISIASKPDRWWLGSIVFILLFYIHPVSGPNWLMAFFISLILIMVLQFRSVLWKPLTLSLSISIFGLIPFVMAFFVPSGSGNLDFNLIKEIYTYRLSSQTDPILRLVRYFIKMQIEPYPVEIFLWITSLVFLFATLVLIVKTLLSKKELQTGQCNLLIVALLASWWIAGLLSTIGIPLLDEFYTRSTGNLPVLREIRRNIRYLLPLLWITFYWIIQTASQRAADLKNNPISNTLKMNLYLFAVLVTSLYFYQVQPFTDPVIAQSINCLQQGKLICEASETKSQKLDFYEHVCQIVQPDELIFPDPSPAYLGDTLIPRYYCQRSIAYTYKDGASTGNSSMSFIENWWKITQEISPLLPTDGSTLNLEILQMAKNLDSDYFIFINPQPATLTDLNQDFIIYQNDYALLYKLP